MPLFRFFCLNKKNRLYQAGFSLVELLIAVSIFSVVIIAIYSTFSGGMSVFRKVINVDLSQQKVLLKIERFAREIRQEQPCRKPLFFGSKTRVSFAGFSDLIPSRITYYYDSQTNTLLRVSETLPEITASGGSIELEVEAGPGSIFLKGVKEAKFTYLFLDLKMNDYVWLEEWPYDYLPVAVKLMIRDERQEYVKTVFLPRA